MSNYLKIFIVFMIPLFISCDDNIVGPEDANSFFPLSNGNKWFYKRYTDFNDSLKFDNPDKEYDLTYEIIGSTNIDGKTYSMLEVKSYDYNSVLYPVRIDTNYCRTDGENLVWKGKFLGEYYNRLYVDFSIAEGDTFNFIWQDNFTYVGKVKTRTWDSITIYYEIPGAADEDFEVTFLKNIGLQNQKAVDWGRGILLSKFELK